MWFVWVCVNVVDIVWFVDDFVVFVVYLGVVGVMLLKCDMCV